MSVTQPFPQLSFELDNPGAPSTVYTSSKASDNQLTLVVTTNTDKTAFTPGTLVPKEQAPQQTGSLLYLNLTNLNLSAEEFQQLQVKLDGWQSKNFTDSGQLVCLTPAPGAPVTLNNGDKLTFKLEQFALANPPQVTNVQFSVIAYRVTPITFDNIGEPTNFSVGLLPPPNQNDQDLHQVLKLQLTPTEVVTTIDGAAEVFNALKLDFLPGDTKRKVVAGNDTTFTVSFVYADDDTGYGALATLADAKKFSFLAGFGADQWTIDPNSNLQTYSWTLKPPPGKPLLGTGAPDVEFLISNIVTRFQPGPTAMLVTYSGVPGYQSSSYSLLIDKLPHAEIQDLQITPNPTYLVNGQAEVELTWESFNAVTVMLKPDGQDETDVTDVTSYKLPVSGSTAFTLTAQGAGSGNADNTFILNGDVVVLPRINSFTGAPTEVYAGGGKHEVKLAWAVDTEGQIELSSSAQTFSGQVFGKLGTTSFKIDQAQMITLTPQEPANQLTLTRQLLLAAFNPVAQNYNLSAATSGVAVSPTAPFVALTDPTNDRVLIVDTVQYSALGNPFKVGQGPTGIAISADGSLLVTANSGGNSLSLVSVTLAAGQPVFNVAQTIKNLAGAPQQVVITPDKSHIYVSLDLGANTPGQVIALQTAAGQYEVGPNVTVGKAPRGLALEASGARLFVANSADDSVSVLGIQGDVIALTNTIQAIAGTPTGLALTRAGEQLQLLVACPNNDTVVALDPNSTASKTLSLGAGKHPTQLAVTPSGAYAFVTNQGDGTLTLLDCWGTPADSSVLPVSLQAGSQPAGVAVSPDGLVVLAANSSGLCVVTLQTYEANQPVSTGGKPTDVAASPDGKFALIWHNAVIQPPIPGASYYDLDSQLPPTRVLHDIAPVACVFAPDPKAKQAFAISNMEPLLYVLDLSDPQNPVETEITLPGQSVTVALGQALDGQQLFVVLVDGDFNYSLQVVTPAGKGSWKSTQTLSLYQGKFPGQMWLQATADASQILIADSGDNRLTVVTRTAAENLYQVAKADIQVTNPAALTILPDASKAYVLGAATPNTITIIDLTTFDATTLSLVQSFVQLQSLIASPDGRRLLATDSGLAVLRILDPTSLRILQTLPLSAEGGQVLGAAGLTITPDGSKIFTANTDSGTLGVLAQVPLQS